MRVVFMGTPDFAVPSLRALAQAHEVPLVFTRPILTITDHFNKKGGNEA